jgi:DNA-directed RNA polymerase specialized sigma24 family protein
MFPYLSSEAKAQIVLLRVSGLSVKETASLLGVSINTV